MRNSNWIVSLFALVAIAVSFFSLTTRAAANGRAAASGRVVKITAKRFEFAQNVITLKSGEAQGKS